MVGPARAACIDVAKADPLSFEGTLHFKVFPGPPNFTDVRNGDAPQPGYLLKLDAPICAIGAQSLSADKSFDDIELLLDDSFSGRQLSAGLRHLIGQRIAVEGHSAFGAGSAHDHASLMLPITSASMAATVAVPNGTAMTTVQGFYLALRAGDGDEATKFVIPGKRAEGPLSAAAMTNYYGSLTEPLTVLDISSTEPNEYRVRYTFVPPGKPRCNGTSLVRTARVDGENLIESIRALNAC